MKKRYDEKQVLVKKQGKADTTELFGKIQEHLISLEKKIDSLMSRSSSQSKERYFRHSHDQDRERQRGGFREKTFYKVICAECGQECEVPFKPAQDRPVYCKECFSMRRNNGGLFEEKRSNSSFRREDNKKDREKKKTFFRGRKKR